MGCIGVWQADSVYNALQLSSVQVSRKNVSLYTNKHIDFSYIFSFQNLQEEHLRGVVVIWGFIEQSGNTMVQIMVEKWLQQQKDINSYCSKWGGKTVANMVVKQSQSKLVQKK